MGDGTQFGGVRGSAPSRRNGSRVVAAIGGGTREAHATGTWSRADGSSDDRHRSPQLALGGSLFSGFAGSDQRSTTTCCFRRGGGGRKLIAQLERDNISARCLTVSHAFHSPLMAPILAEFGQFAERFQYQPASIPFISNLTGRPLTADDTLGADYWCRHLRSPVLFFAGLQADLKDGCNALLEIGPHPTLIPLARRAMRGAKCCWAESLREGGNDWEPLLKSLGRLYVRGVDVDWQGFEQHSSRLRVSLPSYPFQRTRQWVEVSSTSNEDGVVGDLALAPTRPGLGRLVRSADETRCFERAPQHLRDYRLCGATTYPVGALIQSCLAAAELDRPGQAAAIANLQLTQGLAIPDGQPCIIQSLLPPTDSADTRIRIMSHIGSSEARQPWTLNAVCHYNCTF